MRAAKSAAVVLAVLLVTMHLHVGFPLIARYGLAVPVPVLVLLAELDACAVLGWLIARAAGWRTWSSPRRYA